MVRPIQPNCARCNFGGAGIICDKWGHPTAWEPLCFACGAIPPEGVPTYPMCHRPTWWPKGPRRGTSTNPSSSEEDEGGPRCAANADAASNPCPMDISNSAPPSDQYEAESDENSSDESWTPWRW